MDRDLEMGAEERFTSLGAVLIADDHEVTRFGLSQLVRDQLGASRVLEAARFETAVELLGEGDLELAIVDLSMPGLSGPQELTEVRQARPDVKLVVLSASTMREDILSCLAAGVHGYIIKTEGLDELVGRLRHVLRGEIYVPPRLAEVEGAAAGPAQVAPWPASEALSRLTPRQTKVLLCLEKGMTNKEIARELGISDRTVKMHLSTIYPLLGVHNRTQAAAVARSLSPGEEDENPSGEPGKTNATADSS